MIGGDFLISIPITIPIVLYLLYLDKFIFNSIYLNNLLLIKRKYDFTDGRNVAI